ncbi:MAG: hypothetical protein LBQ63_02175 [Deltaproteobacteria bacterium]|jgi:hypothetical protein|nr:hypothetical protein [Deltaproteobacteria bacterium]
MTGQQEQRTVRGYIVSLPPRKGAGEESAKVALQDEDGREYHIVPKGVGIDLVGHISARVEATGIVRQKEDILFLWVRRYTVDDAFEDDWYDDN